MSTASNMADAPATNKSEKFGLDAELDAKRRAKCVARRVRRRRR